MTDPKGFIPTVLASQPLTEPPLWAILERRLMILMDESVEPLLSRYVREDGSILWPTTENFHSIDGLDDAYESFHNWPLYYILGGADRFRDLSLKEFDAITLQFTQYDSGHGHPWWSKNTSRATTGCTRARLPVLLPPGPGGSAEPREPGAGLPLCRVLPERGPRGAQL